MDSLKEKKGVSVIEMVEVIGNESWGVEKGFPIFGNTLESNQGFHRKSFENIYDDIAGYKSFAIIIIHCYGVH